MLGVLRSTRGALRRSLLAGISRMNKFAFLLRAFASRRAGSPRPRRQPGAREEFRRADQPRRPAAMARADVVRAQPRRLAARQGQCRDASSPCSSNGAGTRISSSSTCSIRRRSRPRSSWSRPQHVTLGGQEPPIPEDPTSARHRRARFRPMSPTRATATSPRRWSTSITACPTIMTRSRERGIDVKRQDRPRPLRRRLARPQAQARAGTWRGRLPDLFRSGRRRLRRRRSPIPRAAAGRRTASSAARSPT